jgi:hypothetical protein
MVRSAGSHGAVDVIVHDAAVVKWIQMKTTAEWTANHRLPTALADATAALLALRLPPDTKERWVYAHVHRSGWFRVRVDDTKFRGANAWPCICSNGSDREALNVAV